LFFFLMVNAPKALTDQEPAGLLVLVKQHVLSLVVALAPVLTELFAFAEPGNAVFARATGFNFHLLHLL